MSRYSPRARLTNTTSTAAVANWFGNQFVLVGSYDSIATITVGSGGSANIDFQNIPAIYTHLQLRGIIKSTSADTTVRSSTLRLNNDTGNNYSRHYVNADGATAGAGAGTSQSSMYAATDIGANATNVFGGFVIDILDYANTNKNKTIRSLSAVDNNGSGYVQYFSGLWLSTSAIDRVTLLPGASNFAQYSTVALYGIRGL